MKNPSATLAQSITRSSSKQSYIIARLLVDRDLTDDCLRAYAYFRWADDVIDVYAKSAEERVAFIQGQSKLVDRLYQGDRPDDLAPEEEMVADLIQHDRAENSGLQSFIRNFLKVLEFDASRKNRLIGESELVWYSKCLGQSVTDAIQYFIGNGHFYPAAESQYLAATAAHITHMLRDMSEDLAEGFINIPRERLEALGLGSESFDIGPNVMDDPFFQEWVRDQVKLARAYFHEGKVYLDELNVLRCKIAGYWYCGRFECVLDAIERDGYVLRAEYHERSKLSSKLKMGWLAVSLTFWHVVRRGQFRSREAPVDSVFEATVSRH